jgi:hypothetical protein
VVEEVVQALVRAVPLPLAGLVQVAEAVAEAQLVILEDRVVLVEQGVQQTQQLLIAYQ